MTSDTPRTDALWSERLHAHPFLGTEVEETKRNSADTAGLRHEKSMNQELNSEAAETVQTTNVPAVDLPRLVRLFNEYGSSAQSDHADAIDKIMGDAMDKLAAYLAENNVCPRDAMGYCVMIVTQHLSAYGLRRAMRMKRRERGLVKALQSIAGYAPDKMSGFECKEIAAEALDSLPN